MADPPVTSRAADDPTLSAPRSIFVDTTGRRRRWVWLIANIVALAGVTYTAVVGFSLARKPVSPHWEGPEPTQRPSPMPVAQGTREPEPESVGEPEPGAPPAWPPTTGVDAARMNAVPTTRSASKPTPVPSTPSVSVSPTPCVVDASPSPSVSPLPSPSVSVSVSPSSSAGGFSSPSVSPSPSVSVMPTSCAPGLSPSPSPSRPPARPDSASLIEDAGLPLLLFVLGGFVLRPWDTGAFRRRRLRLTGRVRGRLPVARRGGGHSHGPRFRRR